MQSYGNKHSVKDLLCHETRMEKGFIGVFKMKMELILHCTYILDSVTLCSGGGKVGSWGRCGTVE